jgi:hypothetical protein
VVSEAVAMTADYPRIVFKLGRRKTPKSSRVWLERKKLQFSKRWQKDGQRILRSLTTICRLEFPRKAVQDGIEVSLYKWRRKDGNYLGDMVETEPLKLNVYLKKRSTWKTVKSTLIHELIHCIMWQTYYYDYRRRNPTLFEDYFADELITCIVETAVLGKKTSRKICREALNYALSESKLRLARVEHTRKLTKSLVEFARSYKSRMRSRKSDILKERARLLRELPSPLPDSL